MKNESLEDEIKLLKIDYQTLLKTVCENISCTDSLLRNMREHVTYLYDKLNIKIPEKKQCIYCEGKGTIYISPISDCGQSNECRHCNGAGYKYV